MHVVNDWQKLHDLSPDVGRGVELVGQGFHVRAQLCECDYDELRDCEIHEWLLDIPGAPLQWLLTSSRQDISWRYLS